MGISVPEGFVSPYDKEENDTGVVEPTTTAPSSVVQEETTDTSKQNSSFSVPEGFVSPYDEENKEPLVTEIDTVVAEKFDYGNEQNPDMLYEPQTAESYADDTLPTVQDIYGQGVAAEFVKDDTNPYLMKELARINEFFLKENKNTGVTEEGEIRFEPLLVEKYIERYNEVFTPEEIENTREGALIAWTERQKLLEKFKDRASDAGYDKVTDYLLAEAMENPDAGWAQNYINLDSEDNNFVPETKQEFFDVAIKKKERGLQNSFLTAYNYLYDENPIRRQGMQIFLQSDMNFSEINTLEFGNIMANPFEIAGDVGVSGSRFSRMWRKGDVIGMASSAAWVVLDTASFIPGVNWLKNTGKGFKRWLDNPIYKATNKAIKEGGRREEAIRQAARATIKNNQEIANEFIEAFQTKFNVKITKEVDGKTVIDKEALIELGKVKTQDLMSSEAGKLINLPEDASTMAILKPESFEGLIATMVDIQKKMPDEFGKRATRIDDMLHLVIEQKLKPEDLVGILAKNGLKFEEFIVASYGSVSQAGSILATWGQISRRKPKGVLDDFDSRLKVKKENVIHDLYSRYFLRSEAIAKGALVAPLAVAVRNLKSGLVRAPLETLNNVMSNAMLEYSRRGFKGGTKALAPYTENSIWTGTLDTMKYMFSDQRAAKAFSEYILEQSPDHQRQLYTTLNEIQLNLGRGQASQKNNPLAAIDRVADTMMSDLEDFVATLNTPNRVQELMIRNATFYGELKRLVKREYGVDFEGALNEGKLMDFFRDSDSVRPKDARSFINLVDDASRKALRVTYSAQPENYVLRKTAEFISKTPATVVIPFPRFIANGIEYFGELAAGGRGYVGRKVYGMFDRSVSGPMTARESEQIANNVIGLGLFFGFTNFQMDQAEEQATAGEGTGDNYQEVGIPFTELETNVLADYPVAQMNWIARAAVEKKRGTFDDWDAKNEWVDLFLIPQGRTGATNFIVEEFTSMIGGLENEADEARRDKKFGELFGQYITRYVNPLFQVVELERAAGFRTNERKISGQDMIITDPQFQIGARRQATSRGMIDPDREEELLSKQTITDTGEKRDYILTKLFLGTTLRERNSTLDYFSSLGIDDPNFTLGSKHRMYSVQNYQNEKVSQMMDSYIDKAKRAGKRAEAQWNRNDALKKEYTLEEYKRLIQRDSLKKSIVKRREDVGEGRVLIERPLAKATDQYLKIPKSERKIAEAKFIRIYGNKLGDIDFGSLNHMRKLLILAGKEIVKK